MPGPPFAPKNPEFERVVRDSFNRQSFMATLGAAIVHVVPGEVHVSLPYSPTLCQQNGFVHAGALASAADSANGYAAYTLAPPNTDVLAVEFKINLLEPASAATFLVCATVLRPGRTLTICRADVFAVDGPSRPLIATMLSTVIVRPKKA